MPRVVDHAQRRFEIATAVWQVIATSGPAAVTMRSVAAAAEVSVGRIQHYFSSKEQMLEHGLSALVGAAAHRAERPSETEPYAALVDLLTHALPVTEPLRVGTVVWYAYLGMSVDHPGIAAILQESKRDGDALAGTLVAALSGRPAHDCLDEGRALVALADGLAQRVLVGAVDPETATAQLVARVDALVADAGNLGR